MTRILPFQIPTIRMEAPKASPAFGMGLPMMSSNANGLNGPSADTVSIRFAGEAQPKQKLFDDYSSMYLQVLQRANHPPRAQETWPIVLMELLVGNPDVNKYLESQGLQPLSIFSGLNNVLLPNLGNYRGETMNQSLLNDIGKKAWDFAQSQGEKQVTPVLLWRWLMLEDPSQTINTLLEGAGLQPDMISRLRQAPPSNLKTSFTLSTRPTKEELKSLEGGIGKMKERIIGQDTALKKLIDAIEWGILGYRRRSDIENPNRPRVRAILLGPSGAGKSFSVEQLAKVLNRDIVKLDLNEYKLEQSVARLTGSDPGYKGYGDGNSFVDRVIRAREKALREGKAPPIILLDEIEKAHPDVFDVLMQVLDKGVMTSGNGQMALFEGMDVFMTSNIAQREIAAATRAGASNEKIAQIAQDAMKDYFRPEFIGRLNNIINYKNFTEDDARKLQQIEIDELAEAAKRDDGYDLTVAKTLFDRMLQEGYNIELGARNIRNTVEHLLGTALKNLRKELIYADLLPPGVMLDGLKVNAGFNPRQSGNENMGVTTRYSKAQAQSLVKKAQVQETTQQPAAESPDINKQPNS